MHHVGCPLPFCTILLPTIDGLAQRVQAERSQSEMSCRTKAERCQVDHMEVSIKGLTHLVGCVMVRSSRLERQGNKGIRRGACGGDAAGLPHVPCHSDADGQGCHHQREPCAFRHLQRCNAQLSPWPALLESPQNLVKHAQLLSGQRLYGGNTMHCLELSHSQSPC